MLQLSPLAQLLLLPAIVRDVRADTPRLLRALSFIEKKHPREPVHWYLPVIGVAPDAELTVAVDGEQADREALLHEGAEIMLLSPMEGGAR